MVMHAENFQVYPEGQDGKRGLERKPGGDADSALVFPVGELKPVDHFE